MLCLRLMKDKEIVITVGSEKLTISLNDKSVLHHVDLTFNGPRSFAIRREDNETESRESESPSNSPAIPGESCYDDIYDRPDA